MLNDTSNNHNCYHYRIPDNPRDDLVKYVWKRAWKELKTKIKHSFCSLICCFYHWCNIYFPKKLFYLIHIPRTAYTDKSRGIEREWEGDLKNMIVAGFKYREIYFYSDGAGEEKNIIKFHAAIAVAAWMSIHIFLEKKKYK